jgi:hypothetical protein
MACFAAGARADDNQAKLESKAERTACHSTAVEFVATPIDAAKFASEEKKLVFVLHVSGYFEDPKFT